MKKNILIALLTYWFLAGQISAQTVDSVDAVEITYKFAVGPLIETGFGKTDYTLESDFFADDNSLMTIKSQLDFPTDFTSIGGQFRFTKMKDNRTNLMFGTKVSAGITAPRGPMTDRDWTNGFEFSSTESSMEAWSIRVGVDLAGRINGLKENGLFWVAGFQLERYSFDMIDLTGWQIDSTGETLTGSLDYPVGAYEVTWSMPYFGLMAHKVGKNNSLNIKGGLGMVMMSDQDYHILRDFTTKSSGTGYGIIGEADYMYRIPIGASERSVKFGLSASFKMTKVKTTESWVYYSEGDPSDDTRVPGDVGIVIKGIPHEVKMTRFFIGLQLEYEL